MRNQLPDKKKKELKLSAPFRKISLQYYFTIINGTRPHGLLSEESTM